MTGTSDTGETLQSIIIKSAAYCKKEKSPQHEFIWIQFENPMLPGVWNYLVLDRNKFGDEADPRGDIWQSIQESTSVVAQDEFRVSCDGNLNKLLERCGLAPYRTIETITFSTGHFLPLYHFAAVAVATHELRNRYHLIQANCYWFAGIVWEYMIANCPNIKHVVREGTRGKFGVLFSHTTDRSELDEVRTRVQELLSPSVFDDASDIHVTLSALITSGKLFMLNLVGAGGKLNDKALAAKDAPRRVFELAIQQMPTRARTDYLRNLADLVGEISTNRTLYLFGQTVSERFSLQLPSYTEHARVSSLCEVDAIISDNYKENVPPGTATTTDEPMIAGSHQAQLSKSSRWPVKASNIRWSAYSGGRSNSNPHVGQRWSNSSGEPNGLLEDNESLSDHGCKDRKLIFSAAGRPVFQLDVQSGTTHLLLGSSPTASVVSPFLAQILPQISSTLLCLDISNNELTTLPAALASCTQLEELNVSNNPLRALPSTLGALVSLRVLIADRCKIGSLPSQLVQLGALHSLSVRSNRLVMLPVWICAMPSLEVLRIEGNTFAGPWRNLIEPLLPRTTTSRSEGTSSKEAQRRADEEVARQRLALRAINLYLRDIAYLQGGVNVILEQSMNAEPESDEMYASHTRTSSIARSNLSVGSSRSGKHNRNNTGSSCDVELPVADKEFEDNQSWRMATIRAIVEAEKLYVKRLQELVDIYVKPSSKPVSDLNVGKEPIIPAQERKIAFTGMRALLRFHKESFLPSLISATDILPSAETEKDLSTRAADAVAHVFVSQVASMNIYCDYISNIDDAIKRIRFWNDTPFVPHLPRSNTPNTVSAASSTTLTEVTGAIPNHLPHIPLTARQRNRIKQFLQQCESGPGRSRLNLEDYILLPIQQIPTYMVLLDNLLACTPRHPEARDNTPERALGGIVALANSMNKTKRDSEFDARFREGLVREGFL